MRVLFLKLSLISGLFLVACGKSDEPAPAVPQTTPQAETLSLVKYENLGTRLKIDDKFKIVGFGTLETELLQGRRYQDLNPEGFAKDDEEGWLSRFPRVIKIAQRPNETFLLNEDCSTTARGDQTTCEIDFVSASGEQAGKSVWDGVDTHQGIVLPGETKSTTSFLEEESHSVRTRYLVNHQGHLIQVVRLLIETTRNKGKIACSNSFGKISISEDGRALTRSQPQPLNTECYQPSNNADVEAEERNRKQFESALWDQIKKSL